MDRWKKVMVVALLVALLLSVACRFIYHTDREYSYWISLYGESVLWLEERCAELKTAGACVAAEERRSFLSALETYRERVAAWWWPTVVLAALAWIAVVASFVPGASRLFSRSEGAR